MNVYPFALLEQGKGFRLAADVAENPLSFDVATAVELRFAKLRLINLNSNTWFAYLPHKMIHYSVCTNLSARNEGETLYLYMKTELCNLTDSSGGSDWEKEINHLLHLLFSKDPQIRCMFSCSVQHACSMQEIVMLIFGHANLVV